MERALRFALFFGIFLSVWGGMHVYVFARAAPILAPHATRKALWGVGLALGSAPLMYIRRVRNKRLIAIEAQFPDALDFFAIRSFPCHRWLGKNAGIRRVASVCSGFQFPLLPG